MHYRSALAAVVLATTVTAQLSLTPPTTSGNVRYFFGDDTLDIPVFAQPNQAGWEIFGVLSANHSLPFQTDWLTSFQSNQGYNFEYGDGEVFTRATLDAAGSATLWVRPIPGGGNEGTTILPFVSEMSMHLVLMTPGGTAIPAAAPIRFWRVPPMTCDVNGCIMPGGQYRGPGDLVPPNLGGGAGNGCGGGCGAGVNGCCVKPPECFLTPTNDPLGCPANARNVSLVLTRDVFIVHKCIEEELGAFSVLTYSRARQVIAQAQGAGNTHLDLIWDGGTDTLFEKIVIDPAEALEQYCIEWLAMDLSNTGNICGPLQVCTEVHRDMPPQCNEYGVLEGFLNAPCSGTAWQRAHGTNEACAVDQACFDTFEMRGVRLRIRVDCLEWILDTVEDANPGYWQGDAPVFVFTGAYCN